MLHHLVNNKNPVMRKRWMSVPEFGGWDQKAPGSTKYSMAFTEARAKRKQQKSDVCRSLGNEQDFVAAASAPHRRHNHKDSATTRSLLVPNLEGGIVKLPDLRAIRWFSHKPEPPGSNKRVMLGVALETSRILTLHHYLINSLIDKTNFYSVSKRKKVLAYITCKL